MSTVLAYSLFVALIAWLLMCVFDDTNGGPLP